MLRIVIAAIIGFVVWSILWIGSDAVFMAISPSYKQYLEGFQKALETKTPFEVSITILLLTLVKSFICSIIAGLMTALIAKENMKSTLILGILLLAFGIFIQSIYWNYIPLWYHLSFLLMLIPMSVFGGKLKKI
jgi:high-affinity K+ transport system ATPase subunit B